jgi:hypothetical protein
MTTELDEAIAAYRAQLRAQAELADGDLDEIEDHLRSLTAQLREHGMPAADAVTEAARRLGEPRAIAREHSRVRSAFGSRLSALRTWSVLVLFVPMLALGVYETFPYTGLWSRFMLEYALGGILAFALALRLGWARPVLLGGFAFFLVPTMLAATSSPGLSPLYLVWHLGIVAFLVPWRRHELTASGFALVAYVWAYGAASFTFGFQVTTADGASYAVSSASSAAIAAFVATAGAILRARWSTVAGGGAAVLLGVTAVQLLGLTFRFYNPGAIVVTITGCLITGALAAVTGAVLAWRTARSTLGSLRAIRS